MYGTDSQTAYGKRLVLNLEISKLFLVLTFHQNAKAAHEFMTALAFFSFFSKIWRVPLRQTSRPALLSGQHDKHSNKQPLGVARQLILCLSRGHHVPNH